jgi:uncharacterized membrane protein YqhA
MLWSVHIYRDPCISSSFKIIISILQVDFMQHTLRFEVMEANMFARQIVVSYGFDVLDIHYHLRMQIHRYFWISCT